MTKRLLIFILLGGLTLLAVAQPTAIFTANKVSGCSPLNNVTFTSTSTGGPFTGYFWDFGNGNTSTLPSPSASFITPGTYTVKLTVTSASGSNTMTRTDYITVFANPVADFTSNKPGGCAPDTVCFTDLSVKGTGVITRWAWDFGDGNSSTLQNPCNRYTASNFYKVTLVITDTNGCQSVKIRDTMVTITTGHVANFVAPLKFSCHPPLTVAFKDTSLPALSTYTYLWDFGDGNTSTQKNPLYTYTTAGNFTVTLRVSTPNGCVKTKVSAGFVSIPDVKAGFTLPAVTSGCAPFAVTVTNTSTPDLTNSNYRWFTVPAGPVSNLKNPTLTFNNPGTYSIFLKDSTTGCVDTFEHPTTITVFPKPTALFTPASQAACVPPYTASFTDASTNAVSWLYNFGDGNTSTSQSTTHTYSNYGIYKVTLIVANAQGCLDTFKTGTVRISKSGFISLVTPKEGCKPLTINFTAIDTGAVALTNWSWRVNGVLVSIQKTDSTILPDTGVYIITCTGSNSFGCSLTTTDTVRVGIPPVIDFVLDKHEDCFQGNEFILTNTTTGANKYFWKYGNNNTSTQKNNTINYIDTGRYVISLDASYYGCKGPTKYDTVYVRPPKANFAVPTVNCANDTLQMIQLSKGGNKWLWTFGDGEFSTLKAPGHEYLNPGTYTIKMVVWDTIYGCSDSMTKTVNIPNPPIPKFIQSDSAGCPGMQITFTDQSIFSPGFPIVNWTYKFGDGQVRTLTSGGNTTMTFSKPGYSYAQLTIKDSRGCTFTYRKDSALYVYFISAKFSVIPDKGCIPVMMTSVDSSSSEFPVVGRKWLWGTGDSTVTDASITSVTYMYNKVPNNQNTGYSITYSILDSMGCRASASKNVKPSKPVPTFTTATFKRCGIDSVLFTSTSTGLTPLTYKWDFANGQNSTNPTASQKYSGDSVYSIRLIVKDGNNCYDTLNKPLAIHAKTPVVGFYGDPLKIYCPGPPVFFYDTSVLGASPIKTWEWDFGDGIKSSLKNPGRTYIAPGVYNVSLKITDTLGCVSSILKPGYIIIGGPVGTYNFTPKNGCTPLEVILTATSPNAKKFEWDLADGNIDSNAVDTHVYTRAGVYYPNMTLTDSNGCKIGLPAHDSIVVYPLPKPDFTSDKANICRGGTVKFTDKTVLPDSTPIRTFIWRFGTGDSLVLPGPVSGQVSYQYLIADTFDVSLTVIDTLGCMDTKIKSDTIIVSDDTIPPRVPTIYRATVIDNNTVLMEFTRNYEYDWARYTVFYNYDHGSFPMPQSSVYKSDVKDTTFIEMSGVNTLDYVYSYVVSATDVCNNESALSVKNTTINISATALMNAVKVDWTAYRGWDSVKRYELYRKDSLPTAPWTHIVSLWRDTALFAGLDTISFVDTNTVCYKTFYYQVKAVQDSGLCQESWSDTAGAVPLYEPTMPPTRNVRATVVDNHHVLVQWYKRQHKLPFTFVVFRAQDDGTPSFYRELAQKDTFLLDYDVNVQEHSYTYVTYLKDNCGGFSPASNIAKTMVLKADLEQNDILKYDPKVTWNAYEMWSSGIDHYKVEFFYDSLKAFYTMGNNAPDDREFSHKYVNLEQKEYCYRVTAYQTDSQYIFSESNIACVSTAPRLYAPNVFTINGDNLNEVFQLGGCFLETFHVVVYNRWGEFMFESDDIHKSWDGTLKGKPCPAEVYVYLAEGTGRRGQRITLKGNVTLLR